MLQSRVSRTIYWGMIIFFSCFTLCTSLLSLCESTHPIEVRSSWHKLLIKANTCDVDVHNIDLHEEPEIILPNYVRNGTELFTLMLLRKNEHDAFFTIHWLLMNILPVGNSLTTNKTHSSVLRDYYPPKNSSDEYAILVYKQTRLIQFNITLNHSMITEFKPTHFEATFQNQVQNYSLTTFRTLGLNLTNPVHPGNLPITPPHIPVLPHPHLPVPSPPSPPHNTQSASSSYNHVDNQKPVHSSNYTMHLYNSTVHSNHTLYNSSSHNPNQLRPPISPAHFPGGEQVPHFSNNKPSSHKNSANNLLSNFKILMLPLFFMTVFRSYDY